MIMLTRHEIPESMRVAKQWAMDQFLLTPQRPVRRVGRRITAHPQHNLVGVGIGAKIIKNKATRRPSVRFYVAHKLDPRLVPQAHMLPREISGVETDVVETGRLQAQIPAQRKRNRPAKPGCSIGFALEASWGSVLMAGTLGAIVADGSVQYILSNNHVLADENHLSVGAEIYQPGLLDHGDPARDAIAKLSRFVPLDFTGPNRVDCAIAEILDQDFIRPTMMARVGKLAGAQPIAVIEGMAVEKVGRGSGYTLGKVFDVSATLMLAYETGELSFVDQILIRGGAGSFSEYGDSGALVVDTGSGRAAGLLIGGQGDYSVANHLEDVLTALGVVIVV